MNQLTETEAQTLAVFLQGAMHSMATANIPGTDRHVWENSAFCDADGAIADIARGFYDIVPPQYGIYL